MLSILVCHSYYLRLDQKQLARAKPYPPLATLQVASLLREAGHEVSFFDAMLAAGVADFERQAERLAPQVVLFYEDTFNFLSKMCLATMREAACAMITCARRTGARVISAGPDVTDAPRSYLEAGAEFALLGEGLSALLQLLPRINADPRAGVTVLAHAIAGVIVQADGQGPLAKPGSSALLPRLPSMAAWDLLDVARYRDAWLAAHGQFSLNMTASRGCSFRCAWCAKPTWGQQYLQRDPHEVALELAHLKRAFKPDHIWFADDIFGFRVEWVAEFASASRALDAQLPFTIQTRADLASDRMVAALREAGCREVWLGAESGSQRVLDAMNKGTTVGEIVAARRRFAAAGIRVGFFIQLGYLDEDLNDIVATRELLSMARPDDVGVSVSYPLPGTKFHELVKAQLRDKTHWEQSDDLAMLFHGTYSSSFYRAVRNLLHEQVVAQAAGCAASDADWHSLLSRESEFRTARSA